MSRVVRFLSRYRSELLLFMGGIILRLVLIAWEPSGDLNNHIVWMRDILKLGGANVYEREFSERLGVIEPNYPPLALYLFLSAHYAFVGLKSFVWMLNTSISLFPSAIVFLFDTAFPYQLLLKLPAIIADIGLAAVVGLFAYKLGATRRLSRFVAAAVLFNPAFFYNSAVWGQIDVIPLLFGAASLYVLLYSRYSLASALLFCMALLTKQTVAIFVPIFFVAFMKQYGLKKTSIALCISALFFSIIFLPFNPQYSLAYPFMTYITKILTASGSPFITNHAFNLWYLVSDADKTPDTALLIGGLSYQITGYFLWAIALGLILLRFIRQKMNAENVLYASTLVAFSSFLLLTRMHERHLILTLPFLLLLSVIKKEYRWMFGYLSVFHFLNMYHSWWNPEIGPLKYLLSLYYVKVILIAGTTACWFLLMKYFLLRHDQFSSNSADLTFPVKKKQRASAP